MTWDPEKFCAFDFETWRIQPGVLSPPPVCAAIAMVIDGRIQGELLDAAQAHEALLELLNSDKIIVAANAPFDMLVGAVDAAKRRKDIVRLTFEAFRDGRVFDVLRAEELHAIAEGTLGKHPRTGQTLKNAEGKATGKYSLANVTEIVLGRSDAKENDRFRTSYALLQEIPMSEWPADARRYPVDDACNTLEVALAQVERNQNLHVLAEQSYKHWCLHLGAAWGMLTDPAKVDILAAAAQAGRDAGRPDFEAAGFLRPDGTECQAVVKKAVALAYGCTGECAACAGSGKVPGKSKKPINCATCSATGLDLASAPVPRTDPSTKFPCGQVQSGRDVLTESGDETLGEYSAYQEDDKILDSYVPFLRQGATAPIVLSPNPILETLRVSYNGLIQTLPRQVSARLQQALAERGGPVGVRDCFIPRAGEVFYSCDFVGGELVTFAESAVERVGFSKLGEALNAGMDAHAMLGAAMAGLKYDQFVRRLKDKSHPDHKRCKNFRQCAKWGNFGFQGGMGAVKFVLTQRRQGTDTPWPGGPSIIWDGKSFVQGYKGLRLCILLGRAPQCGLERVTEWNERPCPPTCRACIEAAEEIRANWFTTWPEARPYLRWHGDNVKAAESDGRTPTVTQPYTGYVRGGVGYCSEANGDFQSLLAVIAGRAQCRVSYAQYCEPASPLFGSRSILFAHDELFGGCRTSVGHEVAAEVSEHMLDEFRAGCPNHRAACKVEPALMQGGWYKAAEPRWVNGRLVPWSPE